MLTLLIDLWLFLCIVVLVGTIFPIVELNTIVKPWNGENLCWLVHDCRLKTMLIDRA